MMINLSCKSVLGSPGTTYCASQIPEFVPAVTVASMSLCRSLKLNSCVLHSKNANTVEHHLKRAGEWKEM